MSDFEAHTFHGNDRIVVALAGECDLLSRDRMTETLLTAVQSATVVIVDLTAVRFFDSSGLHALVTAHHAALRRAGSLHVVNATGTVATVLEMTGLMELLRHPDTGPADANEQGTTVPRAHVMTYSGPADLPPVRAFARTQGQGVGLSPDQIASLTIAVSELVTNTLQHTTGGGEIRIWAEGDQVTCDVVDGGPMRAFGREMPAADAVRGRGLAIVERLCDEAFAVAAPEGTIVRLRFTVASPSASG